MIDLLHQFGGKKDLLVLLMIVIILFLLNSIVRHKKSRIVTSTLSSLYIVAQTLSLYFTQSFIGYQFYVHANLRGVLGMESLFMTQFVLSSIWFVILFVLNFKSRTLISRLISKNRRFKFSKIVKLSIVTVCVVAIAFLGNFNRDTKTLLPLISSHNTADFDAALRKYNMTDYVKPADIQSTAGNNIIVISMESIEKGFLNEKYASITPNLNTLKNKWNYFDVQENSGSHWTTGSLYTSLTGFPAFFGAYGNFIFQTAYHSNISSITHALNNADYTTTYISGNTDYSGVKEMLNTFEIDKILDYKNSKNTGLESKYGLRDKEVFSLAKKEVEKLNTSDAPFALFISTTDTHFPDGFYDERMEAVISPKSTELEFCVASLDYLIGDFITYLEEQNILDNTTIFLFPDHLKMGDPTQFNDTGKRSLYCITNAMNKDFGSNMYQIDLPKIILEGANVNHNIKFLTDYIQGDKSEYILDNVLPLTEINTSGILNSTISAFKIENVSKHYEDYKKDTQRYIAHAGGLIDGHNYTNSLEALDLSYKKGFKLFELDIIKTADNHFVAAHDWDSWAEKTNWQGEIPPTKEQFLSQKILGEYTPLVMNSINTWFQKHDDAILVTDKVNAPNEFSNQFIDNNRLMMELFDMNAIQEGLKSNILSAMVSQSVLRELSHREIKKLANSGLRDVAISRHFIKDNRALLKYLKSLDIKAYAYNVNQDEGMDEEYVTKYEMDDIFGIYADDWSFINSN